MLLPIISQQQGWQYVKEWLSNGLGKTCPRDHTQQLTQVTACFFLGRGSDGVTHPRKEGIECLRNLAGVFQWTARWLKAWESSCLPSPLEKAIHTAGNIHPHQMHFRGKSRWRRLLCKPYHLWLVVHRAKGRTASCWPGLRCTEQGCPSLVASCMMTGLQDSAETLLTPTSVDARSSAPQGQRYQPAPWLVPQRQPRLVMRFRNDSRFLWFSLHCVGQGYHVYWLKCVSTHASVYTTVDKPLVWSSSSIFFPKQRFKAELFFLCCLMR